ncbi:hypothetical protein Terro_0839 [Terriglobus roseus DSM 18391]|uniref:Outer membrane receptor proteins, mostly Fe transport n=2 Tax=Terriglobus roseus TaxID=392734 RepID=I3ZD48_TERRK|nr:hypothetical protein Terro_0839 [Terriglobus roseus DSM 18391]
MFFAFLLALGPVGLDPTSLAARSSNAAELSGLVTDKTGAALPRTNVTLLQQSTQATRIVVSDAEGRFSFAELTAGNYRISAQGGDFAAASESLTYSGTPLQVNFHLAPVSTASSVDVTADANALDPTAPARVSITLEEMERIPSQSVSSPLSSLITNTTPGVAANSNGSFHPLGDHAEASFVIDGQPVTDQQSRTFSSQISLDALQSLEVRVGAPQADVGDKTSMVIVAHTKSGLDQNHPTGEFSISRGSFNSSQASARVGYGTERFGTFTAIDALNSGRFLDTPELVPLHANGNLENIFQRLDYRLTPRTSLQLNAILSHSWFQTPNTYDQHALRQNQRQTIQSFNIAPSLMHTFNAASYLRTNLWVRQDKVRYRPSTDTFADTPAYLAQSRRLTNAGIRSEYSYAKGRHNVTVGAEWKHTFLAERFATGLTDPMYNSPCLAADGASSPATSLTATTQCAGVGLAVNPDFLPNLLAIDLTRGGTLFAFAGQTDIKQEAVFGQDSIQLGNFTANLGLRFDKYNGLARSTGLQPRVGVAYNATPLRTVLRMGYSRVFITPYNENLIVASSAGPGSTSAALGAANSAPLATGHRNQFNIGSESQLSKHLTLSSEYFWKFTYGAYDFDVLLNSPLTFPTQFRKSKIDGGLLRLSVAPTHGFAGYFTASHVRSRLFGPETGGVSFNAPYSNVTRPDHDQGLATNTYVRYQLGRRGPWAGFSWRYDGGLVSVATPDAASVLRLTGDEQAQIGLHCGSVFAAVGQPVRSCAAGSLQTTRIRIPPAGTEDDDRNPSRIAPRSVFDISLGEDDLYHHERQQIGIHADIVNLTNKDGLYNFLSTFSGTHFLTPRAVTVQLTYAF